MGPKPRKLTSPFLLHDQQITVRLHELVDEHLAFLGPVGVDLGMRDWTRNEKDRPRVSCINDSKTLA